MPKKTDDKEVSIKKLEASKKRAEIAKRRVTVAANLLGGATIREIASTLDVSVGTVAGDKKAILDDWRKHYEEDIDEWVHIQLRRLDMMLNGIWDKVRSGSLPELDRALRIMERQDQLLGLDATPDANRKLEIVWTDVISEGDEIGAGEDELNTA